MRSFAYLPNIKNCFAGWFKHLVWFVRFQNWTFNVISAQLYLYITIYLNLLLCYITPIVSSRFRLYIRLFALLYLLCVRLHFHSLHHIFAWLLYYLLHNSSGYFITYYITCLVTLLLITLLLNVWLLYYLLFYSIITAHSITIFHPRVIWQHCRL